MRNAYGRPQQSSGRKTTVRFGMGQALRAAAVALLVTFVATTSWAADPSEIDLVVAPASLVQPVSNTKTGSTVIKEVVVSSERGAPLAIEAAVSNVGAKDSGPFAVRIYLANRSDGSGVVHEFDVVWQVSLPGNGQTLIAGEYVIPSYPVVAGRSYWLVFEADSGNEVAERDESNNRRVISTVSIPCDDLQKEDYTSEYLCPKFGEND